MNVSGYLYYHDLFLSARGDVAILVSVPVRLLAVLLVPVLLVLLQTGLQLRLLLIHRGAVEATLLADAAVGQAVVVLAHGRHRP